MIYFQIILASFVFYFVAIYGLVSYFKTKDDAVENPYGRCVLVSSVVALVVCAITMKV